MLIMNFLDSLLDKIPIIRDMDKKKRILAAGFMVFAFVSLLGIIIDAVTGAGGVIALISVAVGFLLMAGLILCGFIPQLIYLAYVGVALYALCAVFQIVTLPTEPSKPQIIAGNYKKCTYKQTKKGDLITLSPVSAVVFKF